MKDNGEEHFEFVHRNVSAEDMNDGKMEYTKFGKVGLNNCVILSHSNILQGPTNGTSLYEEALGCFLPALCTTCAIVGKCIRIPHG